MKSDKMKHNSLENIYARRAGIILRALREYRNWTQESVAQSLGEKMIGRPLNQSTVQRIESGKAGSCLARISLHAEALGANSKKVVSLVQDLEKNLTTCAIPDAWMKQIMAPGQRPERALQENNK